MKFVTVARYAPAAPAVSRAVPAGAPVSPRKVGDGKRLKRLRSRAVTVVARALSPACYSVSLFGSGADYAY